MTAAVVQDGSNRLPVLAADIRREHEAVAAALKDSLAHAIAAGELLLEAKTQLAHGQWLPWLRDHCTISERTAQLYMRVAKNRAEIESQIRNDVADLSLSEATALLMLSSNVRKVLRFARDCEHLSGEELIERCIAEGIGVIVTPDYDPLAGRTEAEAVEWHLFMMFLSADPGARPGWHPQDASAHVNGCFKDHSRTLPNGSGTKATPSASVAASKHPNSSRPTGRHSWPNVAPGQRTTWLKNSRRSSGESTRQ